MGSKITLECKTYYNTGTYASPTWVELTALRGLTLNLERAQVDLSIRRRRVA